MPATRRHALRALGVVFASGCAGPPDDTSTPTGRGTSSPTTAVMSTDAGSIPGPAPHLGKFVLWNDDGTPHR